MNVDDRMGECALPVLMMVDNRIREWCGPVPLVLNDQTRECAGPRPVGTRGGCGAGWGPGACPYRTRDAHSPIRLSTIIRTLGTPAFRWCNYPIRLSNIIRVTVEPVK